MTPFSMMPILAEDISSEGLFGTKWWENYVHCALYGLLGIALMLLAMKIFDWISPRIDVQTELVDKKNMPVAVVVAAIVVGISYIIGELIR